MLGLVKGVYEVKGVKRNVVLGSLLWVVKGVEEVEGVKRNVTLGVKGNDAEIRMDMLMAQSHFS